MTKQKIRIRLKAYDHRVLDQSAKRIVETAERSGAHVVGPVPLPTKTERFTIRRSTFIDKDSHEHYEIRTHNRLIDVLDPDSHLAWDICAWLNRDHHPRLQFLSLAGC